MKIDKNANIVKVDETCHLEILVTRISNDGVTAGGPLAMIEKVVQGFNEEEPTRRPMFLTPAKAIKFAETLRNCGKEAYAQRIEES